MNKQSVYAVLQLLIIVITLTTVCTSSLRYDSRLMKVSKTSIPDEFFVIVKPATGKYSVCAVEEFSSKIKAMRSEEPNVSEFQRYWSYVWPEVGIISDKQTAYFVVEEQELKEAERQINRAMALFSVEYGIRAKRECALEGDAPVIQVIMDRGDNSYTSKYTVSNSGRLMPLAYASIEKSMGAKAVFRCILVCLAALVVVVGVKLSRRIRKKRASL